MDVSTRPWLLRATVLAVALVVGVVAWIADRDEEAAEDAGPTTVVDARPVAPTGLADVAVTLGHPVYWAGPIAGTSLELSEGEDGSVQVRYLQDGSEAGKESAAALTIGSYPLPDPAAALDGFAAEAGSVVARGKGGLEAFYDRGNPNSVYFAGAGNSVQVEVYDPRPGRALGLVLAGRVRPAS